MTGEREGEGEIFIGRASFRMKPVVGDSTSDEGHLTSVSPTGSEPSVAVAPDIAQVQLTAGSAGGSHASVAPVMDTVAEGNATPPEGPGMLPRADRAAVVRSLTGPVPAMASAPTIAPAPAIVPAHAVVQTPSVRAAATVAGEPPRARSNSRVIVAAIAAFVVGVVVTWAVGVIRSRSTRVASETQQPLEGSTPLPPASVRAVPATPSGPGSAGRPAYPSDDVPVTPPVSASSDPPFTPAVGPPVVNPTVPPVPSALAPSRGPALTKVAPVRARSGHATVARTISERGHRVGPAHPKAARTFGLAQPRGKARNDAAIVDPFDDTVDAARPSARGKTEGKTEGKGRAAGAKSASNGFVDPFTD